MLGIEPRIRSGEVPEFVSSVLDAKTGATLGDIVSQILQRIGFETFVYASLMPFEMADPRMVVVTNMSREWSARCSRLNYLETDPCVRSCLRRATPFLWDSKSAHQPNGATFLSEMARCGVRCGIVLAVVSASGEDAMFVVCSSSPTLPDGQDLQLAIGRTYLFASFFHERFFDKAREQAGAFDSGSPQVTKREREVLELAAHGHSSKRIAYELGISESTANFHIASIKRKFGARTRSQAIAHAVQTGLIR
jgi:DNA-binding CsgD family transcriptional regulator